MTKTIKIISLFILSMLLALSPAYAASHSDKEDKADTTSETVTEAAAEDTKKEAAESEEEEEPDCD
ncbi:hypothetical protein [uncultured Cocleimonas sp.]|uniref:hypothetical protein n=1 Tax=uncultured Cocleimonas sp. TaxID=1051587 RepID=UPI0026145B4D|nr:hypothetical protein [uncultured Cocleimonas sp.]